MRIDREKLRNFKWSKDNFLDLHELGIHYFDFNILPSWIDQDTFLALSSKGLTAPNSLPIFPSDRDEIKKWYENNFFKLKYAGVQHLGNECNLQKEEEFEKAKIRILIYRLNNYEACEGAFGHWLIGNFCVDFVEDVFVDYAFMPYKEDFKFYFEENIPLIFGSITKRPLCDFDLIFTSNSFSLERLNYAIAQVKSGIPLHYWERWNEDLPYYSKIPIVCAGGIGVTCFENMLGDNPKYGTGENSIVDFVFEGEGELGMVKFLNEYNQAVNLDGGSKKDFRDKINNDGHEGWYDPRNVLFEYEGKEIKRVSILDRKNKIKYVMAGEESEEFKDFTNIQEEFERVK